MTQENNEVKKEKTERYADAQLSTSDKFGNYAVPTAIVIVAGSYGFGAVARGVGVLRTTKVEAAPVGNGESFPI